MTWKAPFGARLALEGAGAGDIDKNEAAGSNGKGRAARPCATLRLQTALLPGLSRSVRETLASPFHAPFLIVYAR